MSPENVSKYQDKVNELQKQLNSDNVNKEEWHDFKSIDEAKEYVYEKYIDSDIDNINNIDSINMTFKQLDELQRKYPLNNKIFVRNEKMSNANATGNYKGISINTTTFNKANQKSLVGKDWIDRCNKEIKELKKYLGNNQYKQKPIKNGIQKLKDQKKYISFTTATCYSGQDAIKAIISHEYGHVLADQYFGQINKARANKNFDFFASNECWQKCKDVSKTYWQAMSKGDLYSISYYAAKDEYEFFAECFAKKQMDGKLPDYINEMLERVLKNGK